MQKVFLTRMPSGIPGDITAKANAKVDPVVLNAAAAFSGYGLPGKFVAGKFVPVSAAADGVKVRGFLARPYPTQTGAADGSGVSAQIVGDALRSGHITVRCNAGNPAKDGAVYVRVAAAAAGKPIGGIEAAAVVDETEVIPGAYFTGAKDTDGTVEIEYNI